MDVSLPPSLRVLPRPPVKGFAYEWASLLPLAGFTLALLGVAYTPYWLPEWASALVTGVALLGLLAQAFKTQKPILAWSLSWLLLLGFGLGSIYGQWRLQHWLHQSRWMLQQQQQFTKPQTFNGLLLPAKQGVLLAVPIQQLPGLPQGGPLLQTLAPFTLLQVGWPKETPSPKALAPGTLVQLQGRLLAPYRQSVPGAFNDWTYKSSLGVLGRLQVEAPDEEERPTQAAPVLRVVKTPNALFYEGLFHGAHFKATRANVLQHWQTVWLQYGQWSLPLLEALRLKVAQAFQTALGPQLGALLGGLVLGERAIPLEESIYTTFALTGMVHLLAASGMNVAMVSAPVLTGLRWCKLPLGLALLATMAVVVFYCLLTGLPPSIQRAGAMLLLALGLKWFNRQWPPLLLLAVALTLLLLVQPLAVYSVGLQLSVLTTLGILSVVPLLQQLQGAFWLVPVVSTLAVPLAAQVWATPLIASLFFSVPLHSLLLNTLALVLVAPLTNLGFLSVLGVLLGIHQWAPSLFNAFLAVGKPFAFALLNLADWGAKQQWALLSVSALPPFSLVWLYAGLFWLLVCWHPSVQTVVHWRGRAVRLGVLSALTLACLPLGLHWFSQQQQDSGYRALWWPLSPQAAALVLSKTPTTNRIPKPEVIVLGRLGRWWEADALANGLLAQGMKHPRLLVVQAGLPTPEVWEAVNKKLSVQELWVQAPPYLPAEALESDQQGETLPKLPPLHWLPPGFQRQTPLGVKLSCLWPPSALYKPPAKTQRWYPLQVQAGALQVQSASLKRFVGSPQAQHWLYTWADKSFPTRRYTLPGGLIQRSGYLSKQLYAQHGFEVFIPEAASQPWQVKPLPQAPPFDWL